MRAFWILLNREIGSGAHRKAAANLVSERCAALRAIKGAEKLRNPRNLISDVFFFPIWVRSYPLHPVIGGRVPVGVSAVLSMGPRIQTGYSSEPRRCPAGQHSGGSPSSLQ